MRRLLLLPLLCLCCVAAFAQTRTVSGTVFDDKGNTLPGATVRTPDSKAAVQTDGKGQFSISVSSTEKSLIVSYVGMQSRVVTISDKPLTITLSMLSGTMNDVVVIGYGTAKRSNVTSAISSIKESDIKDLPQAGIDQMLQGKVPGVSVASNSGQPGGGVSVRIRGITTLNGNDPLYVVDGVQVQTSTTSIGADQLGGQPGQTTQSPLATLNPEDIASIDILKDASAQAIYGSKGANGVILITTKRGKAGEGKLNYSMYVGTSELAKKLPVMNLRQYATYFNGVVSDLQAQGDSSIAYIPEFAKPNLLGNGTDWQNAIFQHGTTQNHQLSFSGGNGKTTYYMSGNYLSQGGTLIGSYFDRYAFRAAVDEQVKPWLKAGVSSNLSSTTQRITVAEGQQSVIPLMLYNSPATPIYLPDGSYATTQSVAGVPFGNTVNPVALADLRDNKVKQYKAYGNLYADIFFFKDLDFKTEVDYDFQLNQNSAYQPAVNNSMGQVIVGPSIIQETRGTNFYTNLQNYLTYNHTFAQKHAITITAGHEAYVSNYDQTTTTANNLTDNIESIGAGTIVAASSGGDKYTSAGESWFARAIYTFNNEFSITGSERRDGSSNFGPDKLYGYFTAGSAGWTISNEKFLANNPWVNYLKVRLGIGQVGNSGFNSNQPYETAIRLATSASGLFGGQAGVPGVPANVGNPYLQWESNNTYNAGVDATIIKRHIDLTVDVYKKVATKMILPTVLPGFAGLDPNPPANAYDEIEPPTTNAGQMTNTGLDLGITSHNIASRSFTWNTSLEFSTYKNMLNKLTAPGTALFGKSQDFAPVTLTETTAGHPVGESVGYKTNGLYRSQDELNSGPTPMLPVGLKGTWLGDIRYVDVNHDGVINSSDQTFIGNPNPKFTYGMTNTFAYKGFDLSVFIQGVYGDKVLNYTRTQDEALYDVYENGLSTMLNRYSATNPNGALPRFNMYNQDNLAISDRFIESGSYLRIQNITLGYNLPAKWASTVKMSRCRIYVTGQNIYTFTKYSGYDPEIGAFNGAVTSMNIDYGHYPTPRTFTVGANVEF